MTFSNLKSNWPFSSRNGVVTNGRFDCCERSLQARHINKFAKSNLILHPESVLSSSTTDSKLQQIIAGNHPSITFDKNGITVTGPLADIGTPSTLVQETLAYIKSTNRFVIPHSMLNPSMQESVDLVHDRWLVRLTVPISVLNLIAIAMKDPEERNADDAVVGASSAYNLIDYFNGLSVAEARERITAELAKAKNPEEVIQKLIEFKILKAE